MSPGGTVYLIPAWASKGQATVSHENSECMTCSGALCRRSFSGCSLSELRFTMILRQSRLTLRTRHVLDSGTLLIRADYAVIIFR
jgi:hypothetical protein